MKNTLNEKIRLASDATIRLMQADYENFEPEIHRWDWQPGVGLYGLVRAYEILGEKKYLDYVQYYVDRLLHAGIVSYSVNGSIMFEAVLKLYEHLNLPIYRQEIEYYLRWLLRSAPRCQNGCYEHTWTNVNVSLTDQVWIDTLFMCGIVLADSFRLLGREDAKQEALHQFSAHQGCLQDAETGLYRHLYEVSSNSYMAGAFWGRGNGWMAASVVDIVEATGTQDAGDIITSFQAQMAGVKPLQEADGSFRTILNDPATYPEMSATAALGYGAVKGVRLGILDSEFKEVGQQALQAVLNRIDESGTVNQVSSGTSGFIAYDEYNAIPIAPRLYGQALAILLMAEFLK
ncbi:MAG: glycoside hydrolase family 88 protein [Anaerolineae bacterium]|nr:glycoside hydrolase family 88 protein [Anaerolineae bacterium]